MYMEAAFQSPTRGDSRLRHLAQVNLYIQYRKTMAFSGQGIFPTPLACAAAVQLIGAVFKRLNHAADRFVK